VACKDVSCVGRCCTSSWRNTGSIKLSYTSPIVLSDVQIQDTRVASLIWDPMEQLNATLIYIREVNMAAANDCLAGTRVLCRKCASWKFIREILSSRLCVYALKLMNEFRGFVLLESCGSDQYNVYSYWTNMKLMSNLMDYFKKHSLYKHLCNTYVKR
jgi:hypothetical protein